MGNAINSGLAAEANHVTNKLGPLGAEPELSEELLMVQQTVHRYAVEVMRPIGIKLDRMTQEEVGRILLCTGKFCSIPRHAVPPKLYL